MAYKTRSQMMKCKRVRDPILKQISNGSNKYVEYYSKRIKKIIIDRKLFDCIIQLSY